MISVCPMLSLYSKILFVSPLYHVILTFFPSYRGIMVLKHVVCSYLHLHEYTFSWRLFVSIYFHFIDSKRRIEVFVLVV